jgi:ATP/maltotriose-dependent transcriptional regulator MalT
VGFCLFLIKDPGNATNGVTNQGHITPEKRTSFLVNELVQELLDNKLILISAPAGYGKTPS